MLTRSSLPTAVIGLLIIGLLGLPAASRAQDADGTCPANSPPSVVVDIETHPRIQLELARTPQEHEIGLMYREYLPPDSGMLFVYQAESREAYWMYHTLIPLSIAWIDRDGNIVDIQDMPRLDNPDDTQEALRTAHGPAAPYWYALEVNEGWFFQHGVGVGQVVVLCLSGA